MKASITSGCLRGLESRENINKTKIKLCSAGMKTPKTMVCKTRKDRIRNTDIRKQYEIQDIVMG